MNQVLKCPLIFLLNYISTDRLKLTVSEIWHDQFKDKSSEEFKELAFSLKKSIEDIYESKNTESTSILAQVVEAR